MINFSNLYKRFLPYQQDDPNYPGVQNGFGYNTPNYQDSSQSDIPSTPVATDPRIFNRNLFGANLDPNNPPPNPNIPPPTVNSPTDNGPGNFVDQLAKLNSSRPNRLAYQQAVEQGPPQIKRSNWARLGTALTSGAAALGGESVSDATKLGVSAYEAPQMRSDALYSKKIAGLANLAGMEDQDTQDKIKALEAQHSDWFKTQDLNLNRDRAKTEADFTKAQIENIHSEMDKRDSDDYTDPNSGIRWHRDKDGTLTNFGKWALTPAEQADQAGKEEGAKAAAKSPFDLRLEDRRTAAANTLEDKRAASAKEIANIGATSRETVADKNAAAKVAAINARAQGILKQMKPGDISTQVFNDITQQFNSDPDLKGKDPLDYINFETEPGGRVTVTPKPEAKYGPFTIHDSDEDKTVKNKVSKMITDSLAKSSAPGGRGGGAIDNRKYLPDPKIPNHTIPNPNYGKPLVK